MSKGSGISPQGDDNPVSLDAELDMTLSDDRQTEIENKQQQLLYDIIYWGKQDYSKTYYGKTLFEIISDIQSDYDALGEELENMADLESEYETQVY